MQSYGQPPGYQRPGSTASFAGQHAPPQPPGYGAAQGYQSAAPPAQGQWAAPTPTQTLNPWNQPQPQAAGGYNPGTYGAMPGAYAQGQPQASAPQPSYPPQEHDVPPPPPPKPYGFAAAIQRQQQQQNVQNWSPHQQQNTGFAPQTQQGGYPVQGTPQQSYSHAAPPPPSATPGASYFPPAQGGRPASIYGANQISSSSNPPSAGPQQPFTVANPNEQQLTYIPPSLAGQGAQAYMPSNTNPAHGVYVPPQPDVLSWQQAQHAPLQGGSKKFRYTDPAADPSFYAQGHQGTHHMQAQQPPQSQGQFGPPVAQPQQSQQLYGQPAQNQVSQQQTQGQFGVPDQSQQQPVSQGHFQQPATQSQYNGTSQRPQSSQPVQHPQQQSQWQAPAPVDQGFGQQQQSTQALYGAQQPAQQSQWQSAHQSQGSFPGQQVPDQDLPAPKPLSRTDTAPSTLYNQPSPQSQPVSPVTNRQSMSFASGHQTGLGRTGSVSSIALANLHAQRAENRTTSPKPAPPRLPTPPPPRDDKSKFSALGTGGPSDWEHFGVDDDDIDDEHFFAKKDDNNNEPAQLDSVELPAHVPSPTSTHGWPSPATHPAPLNSGEGRDIFAPTPPPVTASPARRPPSQPPQQGFVVGDGVIAPLRLSPKPKQSTQAPPTQQSFVMDDGARTAQSTPSQARQPTPAQHQRQPPPAETDFALNDGARGAQTPTQASSSWGDHSSDNHAAEVKIKEEAFEKRVAALDVDFEELKTELDAKIEKLKREAEAAKKHAAAEKNVLNEQIEAMKATAEQAKSNADALVKEKDMTIERLKEDVEGKEHNIEEGGVTIAELRRQLEAEKMKESPKITPADLIPDIDPWYAGSLERYITMLRGEAGEPKIDDKIKTFKAFWKAESVIRGIDYYDAPPPASAVESLNLQQPDRSDLLRGTTNASSTKQGLSVHVPQESPLEEDYDYSPGGRPVLRRKATAPSNETISNQQHFNPSAPSTTILTPTSSVDDDSNKTPVQSPPEEQPPPQYKAYVPPAATPSNDPAPLAHRQTMSFGNVPAVGTPLGLSKSHDEIFFGAHKPETSKPVSRPNSSDSTSGDIPVPAPLSFASNRPVSTAPLSRVVPVNTLAHILPAQVTSAAPNHFIDELRTQLAGIKPDPDNMEELTKTWDKSASLTRRKYDNARRTRQEENEEHNDDLFNNNEISYAEMNQLEDDFKQKEGKLKAQEDRDEYKSYVEAVFDNVYDGLQADIKSLMDLYVKSENLLHGSVAGVKSLEGGDAPRTTDCLVLLKDLHDQIEKRHDSVVRAVAERDKRYKKTETQPLYAAGNIAKMKSVEKHFEGAEKQAALRAKREKAERVGELVNLAEDIVVNAVGVDQGEIDDIITAIKEVEDGKGEEELLSRAHDTLTALKSSSKTLLSLFNALEIELNNSVLDAEIAEARAGSADAAKIQELENEKVAGAKKMTEEYERRVTVLDQDTEEIEELVATKVGKAELSEEQEKAKRLKMALEAAKRRNGHV